MERVLLSVSALALGTGSALAGGIERSAQSVAPLFESGQYLEFNVGSFDPSVSGVGAGPFTGTSSGDMQGSYTNYSFAYKRDLGDKFVAALIVDQPVGANVDYPASAAPYPFAGSNAEVRSAAITGLLRYEMPSNFSVYGGLRAERVKGNVDIKAPLALFVPGAPGGLNYSLDAEKDWSLGYVVGIAWEKPEIAARVALTYNSAIKHTLDTTETGLAPVALNGTLDVEVPQSVSLEFQTGVAKDTLVFGSIRWVDWTAFNITPQYLNTPIVSNDDDSFTLSLGLGHRFNEHWSGAVMVGYEKTQGTPVGNLSATDGYKSIGIAATYTIDKIKITGGIRYVEIGDATTSGIRSQFADNDGVGVGLRIAYNF